MTSRQFRATEREFNHKVKMRKERPTREDYQDSGARARGREPRNRYTLFWWNGWGSEIPRS